MWRRVPEMAANLPPAAPQNVQDGAEAGGAVPDSRILQGVLASARRLYGAGYLSGEQMAEFESLCAVGTHLESLLIRVPRYRAALARGVWWG